MRNNIICAGYFAGALVYILDATADQFHMTLLSQMRIIKGNKCIQNCISESPYNSGVECEQRHMYGLIFRAQSNGSWYSVSSRVNSEYDSTS